MKPGTWYPNRVPLAVGTGALMVFSFPLYGYDYQLDHLVWITPVPLFIAACGVGGKRGFLLGWLAGMTLEMAGFVWILYAIRSFSGQGPVLSSLLFVGWLVYTTLPWGVLGWALGRCPDPSKILWVIPLWVGVEHFFPRLFPWHVGGALYGRVWFLQCVDVLGTSGLSALVFLVSAAIYRGILYLRGMGRFPVRTLVAAVVLVSLALTYGAMRLDSVRQLEEAASGLKVGFVQGNIDPGDREMMAKEVGYYLDESQCLFAEEGHPDLLVWPEGVLSPPFVLALPRFSVWHEWRKAPDDMKRLRDLPVPLVAGGFAVSLREDDATGVNRYNVAVYLQKGSAPRFYKKNHRIPFGEKWIPEFLGLPNAGNLSPGTDNPVLRLGEHEFRNLICYEVVLPDYVRQSAAGADFLVNVTEDAWYGNTAHVGQHLSVLILRCVESRTPLVRCTNVGPSGVVGVTGEFRSPRRVFEADRFVEDLVPLRMTTIHSRGGYLFPLLCLIVGVFGQWRWRSRKASN